MAETVEERRLTLAMNASVRKRLENHGRQIGTADGTDRERLRAWLLAIDYAATYTGAGDEVLLEMVGYLATGGLATNLQKIVAGYGDDVAPWKEVKGGLVELYLGEEEKKVLRAKVFKCVQARYEDTRTYGTRFMELVNAAFTMEELRSQPLIVENIIKSYMDGLVDLGVREHTYIARPDSLEGAIEAANANTASLLQAAMDARCNLSMGGGAVNDSALS